MYKLTIKFDHWKEELLSITEKDRKRVLRRFRKKLLWGYPLKNGCERFYDLAKALSVDFVEM